MVRISWSEGPAIKSYLKIVLVCFWVASWALSSFLLLQLSWIAVYAWWAGNLALAYFLNQTRKHSKANAFDDRLSAERMADAESRYIEEALQTRDSEAEKQRQKSDTEA